MCVVARQYPTAERSITYPFNSDLPIAQIDFSRAAAAGAVLSRAPPVTEPDAVAVAAAVPASPFVDASAASVAPPLALGRSRDESQAAAAATASTTTTTSEVVERERELVPVRRATNKAPPRLRSLRDDEAPQL